MGEAIADDERKSERVEQGLEYLAEHMVEPHAQVEPHFLYNTLANAQVLTRSDPARAEQIANELGISQQVVDRLIKAGIQNMKKSQNYFSEWV